MEWMYPKRLQPGMTIGFLSLHHSSSCTSEAIEIIEQICKVRGYSILMNQSLQKYDGIHVVKQAEQFQYMMTTAPCDAVIVWEDIDADFRFLDYLDYERIRSYGKGFVSHGRCTALHMAIHRYSRLVTYYGPMGIDIKDNNQDLVAMLFDALEGSLRVIEPLPEPPRGAIGTELGSGILMGGHIPTVSLLEKTPYYFDDHILDEMILLVESNTTEIHKLDGILQHCQEIGLFNVILGCVVGHVAHDGTNMDNNEYDVGYTALRYMEEEREFKRIDPFVCYVSTSCSGPLHTLPLGADIHFRYISNTIVFSPYTRV